jgi:hypothetical protein
MSLLIYERKHSQVSRVSIEGRASLQKQIMLLNISMHTLGELSRTSSTNHLQSQFIVLLKILTSLRRPQLQFEKKKAMTSIDAYRIPVVK